MLGTKCWETWNVIVGALHLHFGKAVMSRSVRSDPYYVGQYDVLIWCQWRLDDGDISLCSWDCSHEVINQIATCLVGDTLTSIKIIPPFGDAEFIFSSGKTLKVFCNEVQGDDNSFNWSFGLINEAYYIGINGKLESGKRLGILSGEPVEPPLITSDSNTLPVSINKFSYNKIDSACFEDFRKEFNLLIGQCCHTVSNNEFSLRLDFGGTIKRTCTRKEHEEIDRDIQEEGEYDILIWCTWRLQDSNDAICSSNCPDEVCEAGIKRLLDQKVISVEIFPPACDATVTFSSGLVLKIFCNYTKDSETETNWFFRNVWKLYCVSHTQELEKAKINWNIIE
ncbi:MAG: hypothetical protein LBU34_02935 [Planctomycetaceae bacterium]|nr:hypothetical protein [Planctomycetaceae bacterium]